MAHSWLPWLAAAALLVSTAILVAFVVATADARSRVAFETETDQAVAAITARLDTYVAVLRAGRGLFAGSDQVDADEFRLFVEMLELGTRYPGIQGLGFSQRVPDWQLAAFEARARADRYPGFHAWPAGPRPEYHVIRYLEPANRRNLAAIGYDMFTEPERRVAMERARDTGAPAVTRRITLVQEIDERKQAGFLIYVPVYRDGEIPRTVAERRELLSGFVYAPFRADDLLEGISGTELPPYVQFRLYAAPAPDESQLLHTSGPASPTGMRRVTTLRIVGSPWCAAFASARPALSGDDAVLAAALATVGMAMAALLFVLVRAQVRARAGAEEAARLLSRSQEALRQSQKMEAVGRFAGGVAHDFNNVLTAINGYSELLLAELPPSDPHRMYAEEIHRAGQRAATFVGQLLAFGRKQIVETRVIDLNTTIGEIDRLLAKLVPENIEIRTALEPEVWPVQVDHGRVEQALLNLVANARDAMPDGGLLTITTENVEIEAGDPGLPPNQAPGSYVVLSVADTGIGMSPEVKAHLFEPFFTTKAPGKGTGLGLAMVYGLLRQVGGFVTVDSATGAGTTIRLHFPRVESSVEPAVRRAATSPVAGGTGRLLLAEDDDSVRTYVGDLLRRSGYTVDAVANAAEALARWEATGGDFDLLVTDVVMPGASGRELAERLREKRPGLRVLFVSGYTQGALEDAPLDRGTGYVAKPFTAEKLTAKIRELLEKS